MRVTASTSSVVPARLQLAPNANAQHTRPDVIVSDGQLGLEMLGWSSRDSYPHEAVEQLLQRGELREALKKGWFGDEWAYRVVRAYGLPRLRVAVEAGADLGLDLRNHDGVATVGAIASSGAIASDGHLRSGDVIRAIDGVTLFTCEAVVSAIKSARRRSGKMMVIEAVRPPVLQAWREEPLTLVAGAHKTGHFEIDEPACLTYSWRTDGNDVSFSVVRLHGSTRAVKSGMESQALLVEQRDAEGRGHLVLAEPGRYAFMWDNSHSMLRRKRVHYVLRCVALEAWEAGRQVERLAELEDECARCDARDHELEALLAGQQSRLVALRKQLAEVQAEVDEAMRAKEANAAGWHAAKEERAALRRMSR